MVEPSFEDFARWTGLEKAAAWHDKNARICKEIAADDPRIGADARAKAATAAAHHAASAAGLRHIIYEERRKLLNDTPLARFRPLPEGRP